MNKIYTKKKEIKSIILKMIILSLIGVIHILEFIEKIFNVEKDSYNYKNTSLNYENKYNIFID